MKILKFLTNRIVVVTVALLLQIGFIVAFSNYFEAAEPAMRILSLIVVCFVINENMNSSIKLTWIVFILITPIFGSILYVLTGGKRPRKWLMVALANSEKRNMKYRKADKEAEELLKKEDSGLYIQSKYLKGTGFNLVKNTSAEYFTSGEEAFPVMLDELRRAERFIFIEYFIYEEGEMFGSILEILREKAKAGVDVRLIYDDVGCLFTLPHKYYERLEKMGIKCIAFNPFVPFLSAAMNNRSHRKILVIDNRVAFSGGINIADEYINAKEKYGYWKDNAFLVRGDGVRSYTHMFLDLWTAFRHKKEDIEPFLKLPEKKEFEKGYVQPFCDSPLDDEWVSSNVYMNAINNAKDYIYIFTPYLIPNQELHSALCLAAKKGVDVKIIIPGIPDKKTVYLLTKSYCQPLIEEGVGIYKLPGSFVHSKGFVVDDEVACLGTINLDFRSLHHHFECGCMFYKAPVIYSVREDFVKTLEKCEKIIPHKRFKGVITNAYQAVLRLAAPLM